MGYLCAHIKNNLEVDGVYLCVPVSVTREGAQSDKLVGRR